MGACVAAAKAEEMDVSDAAISFERHAATLVCRRLSYHPCDGAQHPSLSHDQDNINSTPFFWLCTPCLQCDQRCMDCLADSGLGAYDENYGNHGPHVCSSCPWNGLTQDELANIGHRNGPLCGCRLSPEEREFRVQHGVKNKWLFDDPASEIVI